MTATVFALSSGAGRAGVAVIRVSGGGACDALLALAGAPLPQPRMATLRRIVDPRTGEVLDRALVLWFAGKESFTGEPTAEIHVHGGRAVVASVLDALAACDGLRLAEPGEFTRRAFENGKLDLPQVEALSDLIAADTAMQRRQAMRGLSGALGRMAAGWRDYILAIRALLAAEIDFSDEGDVGESHTSEIDSLLLRLVGEMEAVVAASRKGRIVADGFRVALLGRPNSGKSTLLNALAGTDAAIVSEIAGTTRDVIEVRLDWDGYEVVLVDMAGIRETVDPVERLGVARAMEQARVADMRLWLDESGDWSGALGEIEELDLIRVRTKIDLLEGKSDDGASLGISAHTGCGLGALRQRILREIAEAGTAETATVTRLRQQEALGEALAACRRALEDAHGLVELRDHEVRTAERSLDVLVGRIGVEEVLGAVFERFCIGK
jgi:tRNA modification GTPase